MRIPFTKYGLPQVVLYPLLLCVLKIVLFLVFWPALWLIPVQVVLFITQIWALSFFRDPLRSILPDECVLYSPADGVITGIERVEDSTLGSAALKISIFLSVFNVHINRLPCSVRIENVTYKKGRFINAMSGQASRINESNNILMVRLNDPKDRLLVRQISGAIARHIVCEAKENDEYRQGEAFGMIKFGSRTELYIPDTSNYEVTVKAGDKVRAGINPLVRIKP